MESYLKNIPFEYHEKLYQYKDKICDIQKYNLNTLINLIKKLRDTYVFEFSDIKSDENIERRITNYFNKQNEPGLKLGNIISIIKFQHLTVTYVSKLLNNIIWFDNNSKNVNIVDLHTLTSEIVINKSNTDSIGKILRNYIYNQRLKNIGKENKKVYKSEDVKVCDLIKKTIEKILKTIMIIKNNECLSYGSFTCYNINPSISYNDIDIYSSDAYRILIFFMIIIYFSIGYETYLFSIPFITGHISLKFKDIFMIDCIFLDKTNIKKIKKVILNNIYFVDPGLQMLNNFRMLSENFRSFKIHDNMEEAFKKYNTLLNYFINTNRFDQDRLRYWISLNLKKSDIPYKIENNNILFSIKEIIPNSPFDYILIIIDTPINFMTNLSKIDGKFSRKFGAFLNEIFFETAVRKNKNCIAGKSIITQLIDEEKIIDLKRSDMNPKCNSYNILENKNYLIFTNLTTSTYVFRNNNEIVDVSLKNIISFIATSCLYNLLHRNEKSNGKKRFEFGMELYYMVLAMLSIEESRDISEYDRISRYKIKGEHKEISLSKNLFGSIFNNKEMEEDFMDYETFVSLTSLSGGF